METEINEVVPVWVFFDSSAILGPIFPIAMNWRRRLIKFEKIIFTSSKKIGVIKFVDIICQSTGANYELEYNSDNNIWKLKRIMPKE